MSPADTKTSKSDFASKFINLPVNDDAWPLIRKNRAEFLFSNEFDANSWNSYAKRKGYQPISITNTGASQYSVTYKGETALFEIGNNQDDDFVFILNVAKALERDFKFFYCKDSWHSSDLAFFIIPTAIWQGMENEQSSKNLKHRLMPLEHCDVNKFLEEAFCSENRNEYLSNEFMVLIKDTHLPSPQEWVDMFAEYKIDVGWREYGSDLQAPSSVPNLTYGGWYLQEQHKIGKTNAGLWFSDVKVFSDSFKITFKKTEFNKKAWVALLKILVRFNKIILQSGEKVFTQKAWSMLYGEGNAP